MVITPQAERIEEGIAEIKLHVQHLAQSQLTPKGILQLKAKGIRPGTTTTQGLPENELSLKQPVSSPLLARVSQPRHEVLSDLTHVASLLAMSEDESVFLCFYFSFFFVIKFSVLIQYNHSGPLPHTHTTWPTAQNIY